MEKIETIINWAIEREEDAALFYKELQNKTDFIAIKTELGEFEKMEMGHAERLRTFKTSPGFLSVPDVRDLKISDYLTASEPAAGMSYQDILIIAMKKEEKARDLYAALAATVKDPGVQNLFQRLAAEEAKHKLFFETRYDDEILSEN